MTSRVCRSTNGTFPVLISMVRNIAAIDPSAAVVGLSITGAAAANILTVSQSKPQRQRIAVTEKIIRQAAARIGTVNGIHPAGTTGIVKFTQAILVITGLRYRKTM